VRSCATLRLHGLRVPLVSPHDQTRRPGISRACRAGHKREAITVVQQAQDRREAVGEHDQLRELGEVFTFPLARQHYYSAATYLRLGLWRRLSRRQVGSSIFMARRRWQIVAGDADAFTDLSGTGTAQG